MFAGLVKSSSIAWSKLPWKLGTFTTESSWTRRFIGTLIGGCTTCLHGMGSAFCMSPTGSPAQNISFSLMPVTWALAATFRDTGVRASSQEACFQDGPMGINWRELCAITMALAIWGDQFKGERILVHCDNTSVMQIMAKCSSRSNSMMVLVCSLAMFGMQNNSDLCLQHIPVVNNGTADTLSRFNKDQFWHLALDVDPSMMPLVSFPYQ